MKSRAELRGLKEGAHSRSLGQRRYGQVLETSQSGALAPSETPVPQLGVARCPWRTEDTSGFKRKISLLVVQESQCHERDSTKARMGRGQLLAPSSQMILQRYQLRSLGGCPTAAAGAQISGQLWRWNKEQRERRGQLEDGSSGYGKEDIGQGWQTVALGSGKESLQRTKRQENQSPSS